MGIKKKDTVPSELVSRHLREWINRNRAIYGDFHNTCRALSHRSGFDESYFSKLYNGTNRWSVRFDAADRMFCAMGIPNVWYCDDDLAEWYEQVVPEADRLHPIEQELLAA